MGIPEAEMMDCSVGTIVWVRRRNGSWWPGRILGQDELSETHLMSPRSGTPVKLLGREDASVDWYNLEKSKRVKAFRCGEFDDCIRKAEAALGMPPRKREKYARREDAILHALELEKQQLEQKQQSASMGSRKLPFSKKDLDNTFPSNNNYREDEPRGISRYIPIKSQLLSRKVDSSLNGEYVSSPIRRINHSQIHWEDENAETMPRMRGLQDFGLKTASSKRKGSFSTGNKRTYSSESLMHAISLPGRGTGTAQQINGRRSSFLVKRKRSHGASIEESLVRRRDRRRTIVQVLQSSAKLPVGEASQSEFAGLPISVQEETAHRGLLASSGGDKATSYDSIGGHSPDQLQTSHSPHGADSSFLYPSSSVEDRLMDDRESDSCVGGSFDNDIEEEAATVSDASQILAAQGSKNGGRYLRYGSSVFQGQPAKMGNKHFDDSGYSHYASQSRHFKKNLITGTNGVSKWRMKGKRNMRNLSKRHMDIPNGYADEDAYEAEESLMTVNSGRWSSHEALGGYWEEPDDCFHPRFYSSELDPVYDSQYGEDGMFESMLVNVDLKVQASYQGEHVPLVSLMSRLNGKAIIGHPVQVEIMEDGSSELLLADSSLHVDIGERNKSAVPPVWRTARRTAMQRVPRSHPAAHENEESLVQCSPVEPKPPQKKVNTANLGHRSGSRKNMNNAHRVAIGKLSRKVLKKACLSNQKTRALSSFSAEKKNSNNILQRPTPLVTSIPVEAVFSRLREFFAGTPAAHLAEKKDAD
ncbi:uncharacterized protein At1g51745-like [Nymphaea colorata]|nr:uncharacterized protein At1g51745-like [Nymphaea colorata]